MILVSFEEFDVDANNFIVSMLLISNASICLEISKSVWKKIDIDSAKPVAQRNQLVVHTLAFIQWISSAQWTISFALFFCFSSVGRLLTNAFFRRIPWMWQTNVCLSYRNMQQNLKLLLYTGGTICFTASTINLQTKEQHTLEPLHIHRIVMKSIFINL